MRRARQKPHLRKSKKGKTFRAGRGSRKPKRKVLKVRKRMSRSELGDKLELYRSDLHNIRYDMGQNPSYDSVKQLQKLNRDIAFTTRIAQDPTLRTKARRLYDLSFETLQQAYTNTSDVPRLEHRFPSPPSPKNPVYRYKR